MEQFIGQSRSGNVEEAINGLKDPKVIFMMVSDKERFAADVHLLQERFPGVPSISCVAQSYAQKVVVEQGVMITAFCGGVEAICAAIREVSQMPVKYIRDIEENIQKIRPGREDTVCIDFCSGNDEKVLVTLCSALTKQSVPLVGGTAWEGLVAVNGEVIEDGCVYALVKNVGKRIKIYKENIYVPTGRLHIATKTDPDGYMIYELDGKPFQQVYTQELGISADKIEEQTFENPLGRCVGNEIYIVSLRERQNNQAVRCYRKVQPKEQLDILEVGDYKEIINDTVQQIRRDFAKISGIFSVNCLFRYMFFQEQHYTETYLDTMNSLGKQSGMIGLGEHYGCQHTNQTMSCVVFE